MRHTVDQIELKNGAKGLLINVPGATVTSYELNFRAGEFLVPKKKFEVPHLMEHVVLGANEDYPDAMTFQAELNKNGASTNAYTSYYSVAYVGESADFEWDRVLKLQLAAITKPLFLQREFEAEFVNIRDELISYNNNYYRVLGGEMATAFGFRYPSDKQRAKLMENVAREDLLTHYKKTHFTRNLRFIIAGDLKNRRIEVKNLLEAIDLPLGANRFKLPNEKARKPSKPVFINNKSVENIFLTINSHYNDFISQKNDDALHLAKIMLTDTLYSKIFGQARDQGLVYNVGSGHHQSSRNTEWWLSAQVLPDNAPALCDIVIREIKKVQKGIIDDASLDAAKQYALGSFQRSMQTVGAIAAAYHRYFFDEYIEDMPSIPERIKTISKKDMANAMSLMFSEDLGGVGVLGGSDQSIAYKLHEQLQTLWS